MSTNKLGDSSARDIEVSDALAAYWGVETALAAPYLWPTKPPLVRSHIELIYVCMYVCVNTRKETTSSL